MWLRWTFAADISSCDGSRTETTELDETASAIFGSEYVINRARFNVFPSHTCHAGISNIKQKYINSCHKWLCTFTTLV